jgi:hypothetical protein
VTGKKARAMPAVLYIFFSRLHSANMDERSHAAHSLAEIAEKEPELLDEKELRFEIMLMEKLKDQNATATLKSAFARVQNVKRREGYKYRI